MLNVADKRLKEGFDSVSVVDDQIGSPTYTVHLANKLVDMANSTNYGTYHVTNQGYCSWAKFAEDIYKEFDVNIKVNHVSTEEFYNGKEHAIRPENSRFDETKAKENGFELPSYQTAIAEFKKELILKEKNKAV